MFSDGTPLALCAAFILMAFIAILISQVPRPFRRVYQRVFHGDDRKVNDSKRMDESLKRGAGKAAGYFFLIAFLMPIASLVIGKLNSENEIQRQMKGENTPAGESPASPSLDPRLLRKLEEDLGTAPVPGEEVASD